MNPTAKSNLKFPWWWLAAAVVAATLWTQFALTNDNLEVQSIDLVHHVMFVDHLQTPSGVPDVEFVGRYPLLSHRIATAWLPLYQNPIQAVRAAAILSLLVMLIAQWYLLRTQLHWSLAMLVLVGWQALCTNCKLGDLNHYMWDFQYNYSRGVSAAALWLMILAFIVPPTKNNVCNFLFCLGLATVAFRCHIAAGSLALGTLGVWCLVNLLRKDWLVGIGGLVSLGFTGVGLLLFTDEWKYLASLSADNGPMPIRHQNLIETWMPTAILALYLPLSRLDRGMKVYLKTAIFCALMPAATLQQYMFHGKNVTHTIGSYPYNQMLFYTFGLATLLWIAALLPLLKRLPIFKLTHVAAVLAAGWGLYVTLETDAKRKGVEAERDPVNVIRELRPYRDQFVGHYYYDPEWEHASYFVTRAVLGRDSVRAPDYRLHLHLRQPKKLFAEPDLKGVFMPGGTDVKAIFGPAVVSERVGPFIRVDLGSYRSAEAR